MNAVNWVKHNTAHKKIEWLGRPAFGVGALDIASNTQAKAILASWNTTDGQNWIDQYGLMPSDVDPSSWYDRDGQVLAGFTKWWNASGFTPKLPEPGTKGGIAWQDLTAAHLSALQQWALNKGINPGQSQIPPQTLPPTPVVAMDLPTCLQQCQNTSGFDPIALATCSAACAQKFSPSPQTLPPNPLPPPPTPIPPGPTPPGPAPTSGTTEAKTNYVPWVVGGLALLGIGALVITGAR